MIGNQILVVDFYVENSFTFFRSQLLNFLLPKIFEGLLYNLLVESIAITPDLWLILGVLCKYDVLHVLPRYSKTLNIFKSHVNEFALLFIDDVVIANQLSALLLSSDFVEEATHLLEEWVDCEAQQAFLNKVHLRHLLIFLVNHLVLRVRWVEKSWLEPQRNVIEEVAVSP